MLATSQLSSICVLSCFFGVCRALLGSPDGVLVAHSTNLINFTVHDVHLRYKTFAWPSTERRTFGEVRGLDCEKNKDLVCWVDKKINVIRCSGTKPTKDCFNDKALTLTTVVMVANKGKPEGVALDPCNMLLYWTDPTHSTISVAKLQRDEYGAVKPVMSTVLLTAEDGLKWPFAIAVDSCAGYLFFTDVGVGVQKLVRAETDGSNLKILKTKLLDKSGLLYRKLKFPTALALDRSSRTVYLGDGGLSGIFKMDYDGSKVKRVATVGSIYDMALQCNKQNLVYSSTLAPHPVFLNLRMRNPISQRLHLRNIGSKLYYGACSYCDDCTCKSRNLCSNDNGGCSHFCFSKQNSSRVCGCPAGYKLPEIGAQNCIVESAQLLVSNTTKVVSLLTDGNGSVQSRPTSLSFSPLTRMVAIDYVANGGHHYIAYTDQSAVKRTALDGSKDITITNGLGDPKGIATDCVTGNIYYTDMQKPVIAVSSLDGKSWKICLKSPRVIKPFSLALNTRQGLLYFSDVGQSAIYSYSMDCTGNTSRIANVRTASGLAFDENAQVLYWTELQLKQIKLYNILSGDVKELAISDVSSYLSNPFGLTVFGNYLFFTDWTSGCIGRIPKEGGEISAVSCSINANLNGITHIRSQCHRPQGSCGQCKHPRFCMLSSEEEGSFSCVCPSGFVTTESGCRLPQEDFILVSSRHSIMAMSLQGASSWIARLPLPPQMNVIALDYDYERGRIFWTDVSMKKIYSASLDGTDVKVLLAHDVNRNECRLCHSDGLAYDSSTGLLYYTDYASGEICVIDVKSDERKTPKRVMSGLYSPRAIAIDLGRKIYFSEWGKIPRISSIDISREREYDNSLEVLISSNVTWPNALTLSRDRKTLYFGDAYHNYMASYDLESRRVVRLVITPHIFAIDEHTGRQNQKYIYWSDWRVGVLKHPLGEKSIVHLASGSDVYRAAGIKVFSKR